MQTPPGTWVASTLVRALGLAYPWPAHCLAPRALGQGSPHPALETPVSPRGSFPGFVSPPVQSSRVHSLSSSSLWRLTSALPPERPLLGDQGRCPSTAWVKYRLEPHMKVELRNLENQGVTCNTLEDVYNKLCVKFMCPETLDEVELQLRDIKQGKKEKFCDYFARLGAKEQKLYETCGRTELGKQRCSPEAQLMRLENGLDIDFAKFAREQVFRDNRTWPRTMTEASCILNYYDQTYRRFVCKAEKGSDTLLYSEGKNGKDKDSKTGKKKTGSKAFDNKDKNGDSEKGKKQIKERTPEAQAQWDESNELYKKLQPEQFQKKKKWQGRIKACRRAGDEPDAELVEESTNLNVCLKCRCYGHLLVDCKQSP